MFLLLLIATITIVSAAMSATPILFALAIDRLAAGGSPETGVTLVLALIAPDNLVLHIFGPSSVLFGTHADLLKSPEYSAFVSGVAGLDTA
ncbi:hypothetical protein [Phyllobacterium brassicacearum]|uniref:hypothetical protein n=1 Tax=Phyllobacterium brassicacearum TaxID=314235 RepID=UPI00105FD286|nr:hypothetical protein [Phyllobacterium brassicacearum]